jgi:entericidin B
MKRIISVLSVVLFSIGLSACNTMAGMGQDIERVGERTQGAAERQQQELQRR